MKNFRFSNQGRVESILREKELAFDSFAGKLNLTLRKHRSIDNIKVDIEKRTIVPKTKDRRPVSKGRRKNPIEITILYSMVTMALAMYCFIHLSSPN